MAETYIQRFDNEWVDVTAERSVQCCDCGLVHEEDYRIIEGPGKEVRIVRQAIRNNRLTAARRRSLQTKKEGVYAKTEKVKKKKTS